MTPRLPDIAPVPSTELEHALLRSAAVTQSDELCLIGMSGGRDSTALCHGLLRLGRRVVVCHINHQMRGEESNRDEAWVKNQAHIWGCDFDSFNLSQAPPKNETEARRMRLACFVESAKNRGITSVFLAHHAEDQVETMLLALLRGAGLRGAAGMKTSRALPGDTGIHLERPLLETRRRAILTHLQHFQLTWCEDSTNETNFTPRNRLRLNAWPELQKVWERDPLPPLLRFAAAARRDEACLAALAEGLYRAALRDDKLHAALLHNQPEALQLRVLHLWLKKLDVSVTSHILERTAILLQKGLGPAAVSLPGRRRARRTSGWLWLENPPEP